MLRALVTQVKEGVAAGRTLDDLKKSVTIERRAGSVYEKVGQRTFDALFRLPAIESAYAELRRKPSPSSRVDVGRSTEGGAPMRVLRDTVH